MNWNFIFFVNSAALGIGLAMDAFSVSLANGMNEPDMGKGRMAMIAGVFAGFQFLMPLAGWLCVHTIATMFSAFEKAIPWIALILLLYIGIGMIRESLHEGEEETSKAADFSALLVQGVATSIDALSVGFTIASYDALSAFAASAIIGIETFFICLAGLMLGRVFGMKLAGKASVFGGIILIAIGLEIFISGVFF